MINGNMEMMKSMVNIFDHAEYEAKCKEAQIPINYLQQYSMGVGMLMMGRTKYPELDWQDAYTKMFADMNAEVEAFTHVPGACDKKEEHLPSKLKQASKLLKATVSHVGNGMKSVNEEEYARRLCICDKCPELLKGRRCAKCGCFLEVKAKWEPSKCDINKW